MLPSLRAKLLPIQLRRKNVLSVTGANTCKFLAKTGGPSARDALMRAIPRTFRSRDRSEQGGVPYGDAAARAELLWYASGTFGGRYERVHRRLGAQQIR
jgi:hypothetical protein